MNDLQIQAQAYSYFLAEAPELLQTIEQEILTLPAEHTTAKVHNLMRALHTLKGAAANVGLASIGSIAHDLEDVARVFYNLEISVDVSIQSLLLEGYSGLQECMDAQVLGREIDERIVFERLAKTIEQLKLKLGDWTQHEISLPSSLELGFDIVASIFETTVQEQLNALNLTILRGRGAANETAYLEEIQLCLQETTENFIGLAESFELPGFLAINQRIDEVIVLHPELLTQIASLALINLQQAQAEVLAGDRTVGGTISPELANLIASDLGRVEQDLFTTESQIVDLPELAQNIAPVTDLAIFAPSFDRVLAIASGEAELPGFRAFLTSDKFRKRQGLSSDTQDLFDRLIRLCWDWFKHNIDTPESDLNLELLVMTEGLADLDYIDRWIELLLQGVSSPKDRTGLQLYRQSCIYQTVFAVAKYLEIEENNSQINTEFLTELRSKLQTTVAAYKQEAPVTINERGWIDRIILPHNWTNLATPDPEELTLARIQALLIDSHHRSIDSQQRLEAIYSNTQTPELAGLVNESIQLSRDLSIALETISSLGNRG
jgi:two-component system, chemotaxis family, sensor histidine kinase and response regulator PixL